ncbi:hypothetical protein BDW59DRAFT_163459 [Aspergillus cavernicola]|uniref:Uncharacterized protein n=1 Tax=Aspergillus cavernicola TaxID=176166 RepID=A0ABR4I6B7_9EURO
MTFSLHILKGVLGGLRRAGFIDQDLVDRIMEEVKAKGTAESQQRHKTLAVSSLNMEEVREMFGLTPGKAGGFSWSLQQAENIEKHPFLEHQFPPKRAAIPPDFLDLVLRLTLESIEVSLPKNAQKLDLQCETVAGRVVTHHGEKRFLTGYFDYSYWYGGSYAELNTNLLIVEAKRLGKGNGEPQLLAYLANYYETMVQAARRDAHKKQCSVYGILSDSEVYTFYRLASNGESIVSYIAKIMRTAALTSPESSEDQGRPSTSMRSFDLDLDMDLVL